MLKITSEAVLFLPVIVATALLLTAASESDSYCAVKNSTGNLEFLDECPPQPMVEPLGQFVYLSCCTGYRADVTTNWYQWISGTQNWSPVSNTRLCHTSENGQILAFEDTGRDNDGSYLCNVTDGHSAINRTFNISFIDCDSNPTRVQYTEPTKPQQTSVGSVYRQPCEGIFGCKGAVANDSLSWWSYVDEHGHVHKLIQGKQGRYTVKEIISKDETKKAAVLTIDKVDETDFNRQFICSLKMKQFHPVGFNISLEKTEEKRTLLKYIPLLVSMLVVFVALIVTTVLLWIFLDAYFDFLWKSATKRLPERGEHHEHDVMLIPWNNEEDDISNKLQRELMNKKYKVYMALPGCQENWQIDDIEKCVTVIFIISTWNLYGNNAYEDLCFNVCTDANRKIVFVPTQNLSASEWQKMSKDYEKVYKNIRKLCPIAQWPGEKSRWYQRKNFWGKLQRALPRQKRTNRQNNDAAEDGQLI